MDIGLYAATLGKSFTDVPLFTKLLLAMGAVFWSWEGDLAENNAGRNVNSSTPRFTPFGEWVGYVITKLNFYEIPEYKRLIGVYTLHESYGIFRVCA